MNSLPMDKVFPRYTDYEPRIPVWCVTPDLTGCFHRFHHSSPFSPSGRFLGLTRMRAEDRRPEPGETAEIIVVDLETGNHRVAAETRGWDTQLGAHVQWGADDQTLFYNDVNTDTWEPYGVRLDLKSGQVIHLNGTVYHVFRVGSKAVSVCLRRTFLTQLGYGVVVPDEQIPRNRGASAEDGVCVTDTQTGACRMIASWKDIVSNAVPQIDADRYGPGAFYGFHVMWNSAGDRIMLVLRFVPDADNTRKPLLLTLRENGTDIRTAVSFEQWADQGGTHPTWCPDGNHLLMCLNRGKEHYNFVRVRYDGSNMVQMTTLPSGHGHPSLHPNGKWIIMDAYPQEGCAFGDSTAPFWLIDTENNTRQTLVRIDSVSNARKTNPRLDSSLRVDLHPAWDISSYTRVAINGVQGGTRKVFVADLSGIL